MCSRRRASTPAGPADPRTTTTTEFAGFAQTTVQVAERLYGSGGEEAGAVAQAWSAVGLGT